MAIVIGNTAATGRTSTGASHTANLPAAIGADNLLVVAYLSLDGSRHLAVPVGWDGEQHGNGGASVGTIGFVWKETDGTEGATEVFSYNTGTSQAASVSFLVTGYDVSDPFNSDNFTIQHEASEDPWTVASGLLTGVNNSDSIVAVFGGAKAVRSIVIQDADLTLIQSINSGYSVHALYESSPGSSNSAYSNDMSGSREWLEVLLEIKSASAGGLSIPIASYHYNQSLGG